MYYLFSLLDIFTITYYIFALINIFIIRYYLYLIIFGYLMIVLNVIPRILYLRIKTLTGLYDQVN